MSESGPRKVCWNLPSFVATVIFPALFVLSWLTLPGATLSSAIPQPFLSISLSGVSTEVNFSIGQIFTFITFDRAFVLALRTLAVITSFWLSTVGLRLKPRHLTLNALIVIGPFASWFLSDWFLQDHGIIIQPGPTSNVTIQPIGGGSGCIGCLPIQLTTLSSVIILIALGIWIITVAELFIMRASRQFRLIQHKTSSRKEGSIRKASPKRVAKRPVGPNRFHGFHLLNEPQYIRVGSILSDGCKFLLGDEEFHMLGFGVHKLLCHPSKKIEVV